MLQFTSHVILQKQLLVLYLSMFQFSSVVSDSLRPSESHAARQASLSITNSRSLLKLMPIESVMPSSHLILCRPLLLPPIPPSIRVFSSESTLCLRWPKYWSFSFSINPSSEHPCLGTPKSNSLCKTSVDLYPIYVGKGNLPVKCSINARNKILVKMTSHSGGSPVHVDKVFWYKVR